MKEQREDQETRELFIAEVSIYTDECGEIQFHCLNDCLGGGAWLNIERKAKNCELDIEEVNVYTDDCGVIKYECLHDCMGINAMISPWE